MIKILYANLAVGSVYAQQNIEYYRDSTRQILRSRLCGVCHIPPGDVKALKIFDLDNSDWSRLMTNDQLAQIKWRIVVKGAEIVEMHGQPSIHQLTDSEIKQVIEFVDRELELRKGGLQKMGAPGTKPNHG